MLDMAKRQEYRLMALRRQCHEMETHMLVMAHEQIKLKRKWDEKEAEQDVKKLQKRLDQMKHDRDHDPAVPDAQNFKDCVYRQHFEEQSHDTEYFAKTWTLGREWQSQEASESQTHQDSAQAAKDKNFQNEECG